MDDAFSFNAQEKGSVVCYHDRFGVVLQRVTETQNTVKLTDRTWARLLASTNQPSFLGFNDTSQERVDGETINVINSMKISGS